MYSAITKMFIFWWPSIYFYIFSIMFLVVSTIEGIITGFIDNLNSLQPERKVCVKSVSNTLIGNSTWFSVENRKVHRSVAYFAKGG